MKTTLARALGAASTVAILTTFTQAAGAADPEPASCLTLAQIDHTHVVDDQNILFYTRNGDIYLNRLSHAASGLDRNQPFMYRTTVSRLCRGDLLTVLEDRGFGFTPGASSGLGMFVPIDEARAEGLKTGGSAEVRAAPVEEQ